MPVESWGASAERRLQQAERAIRFWRDQCTRKVEIIAAQEAQIRELTEAKITWQLREEEYEARLRQLHETYQALLGAPQEGGDRS